MRLKLVTIGTSAGVIIPKRELAEHSLTVGDEVEVTIKPAIQPAGHSYTDITAHGRFQPPLHVNHWNYLKEAFRLSEHVRLLITNPYPQKAPEQPDSRATWRSQAANNPFSYDERVYMFEAFFKAMEIAKDRYSIESFDITNEASFEVLDTTVPNLVNVYSRWSAGKAEKFRSNGLTVIQLDQPKAMDVSGTQIRELINGHKGPLNNLGADLIAAGFMPQAVPALLEILHKHQVAKDKGTEV